MKPFFSFARNLFAVIGVVATVGVIVGLYLFGNVILLLLGQGGTTPNTSGTHPALSSEQEKALRTVGVDPAALPTEITPEMESCFVATLGQTRVDEIKGGSSPTPTDFFKAQGCIN